MTEPDFDAVARRIARRMTAQSTRDFDDDDVREVVDQLRAIWNARGAADIAKIESELSQMMGSTAAGPYVKNLDRSLRNLDR